MRATYLVTSFGALLLALIFQPEWTLVLIAMTFVFLIIASICINMPWNNAPYRYPKPAPGLEAMRKYLTGVEPKIEKPPRLPVIYGRMVDGILQQLMDLALRDYVGRLFSDQGFRSDDIIYHMKMDIWHVIQNLQQRVSKVDKVKVIAVDLVNKVTQHFERVRFGQALAEGGEPDYKLSPHLATPHKERDYLRRLAERAIELLFPHPYASIAAIRHLLREVLACKMFHPAIQLLTDPDFINQKMISLIQHQTSSEAVHKKPSAYASTFDDFIQMIKSSNDTEELKHIRYNIVTEIMQVSTAQNISKIKEAEVDRPFEGEKFNFFKGRQLKRYLNQLTQAKSITDRRLKSLRGSKYPVEEAVEASTMIDSEVLSLQTILENVVSRRYLAQFLEQAGSQSLIGFWTAVEELRTSEKSSWHQLGAEIFYTYINTPAPDIKVEKPVLKRMDGFLLGDSGPEVFYEVREAVVKLLEEKFYPSFVQHDLYQQMKVALDKSCDAQLQNQDENDGGGAAADEVERAADDDSGDVLDGLHLNGMDRSNYAAMKLYQLQEKLNNKTQALEALRTSLKPESRVLSALEKEVERLEGERRQLEAHLSRTEEWGEHLGQWRASVQSAELSEDKECPQFVLVVHMVEDESDSEAVSTGWVVLRKLSDFQDLHKKLCQLSSRVKQLDLPSQSIKYRFGKQAVKSALEKAKQQIQKYLQFVLEDEHLNQSEALYRFLSPSSERLKQVILPSQKKSVFSLATLFKSGGGGGGGGGGEPGESDEDDVTLLLDEGEGRLSVADGKDGIAEPLYGLLGEIFDMKGVFKWLRRTLITFVQITYDRTINRWVASYYDSGLKLVLCEFSRKNRDENILDLVSTQVHETVEWLFSEQMMYFYIKKFIKSWWPNGQLVHSPVRSQEEKDSTSTEARELLLANIPEVLSGLVGQQSARRGATKVFLTLQDQRLNKQLFYELLEVVLYELCPEMKSRPVVAREETPVELPVVPEPASTSPPPPPASIQVL